MKKTHLRNVATGALLAACAITLPLAISDEKEVAKPEPAALTEPAAAAPPAPAAERPDPKPLTGNIDKGLAYLRETQHPSGGWGQGGGWRSNRETGAGRVEGANVEDPPDIGNTSVALLTFLRAGKSFGGGEDASVMTRAVEFLLAEIDKNKDDTLYVTSLRDTQLQTKIGQYVDTFLATLVLSELKGKLPSQSMEERRATLLERVVQKIEKHQKDDGTFAGNQGWASVLSQGIGSKSLNRAWAAGAPVSDRALRLDAKGNATGVTAGSTTIAAKPGSPSSAGIDLYRYAAQLGGLQEQANINARRRVKFAKTLASADASKDEKQRAQQELAAIEKNDGDAQSASQAATVQLKSKKFVDGYGNNGGEEFLSYMNLSEAMCARGGKEWADWDAKITTTINKAQNEDGSWAGKHCITGRTFCTATALLTLMADRAPIAVPAAEPKKDADAEKNERQAVAEAEAKKGAAEFAEPTEK